MLQLNLFYSFGYFYMYSCENTKVCDILIIINDTVESQEFSTLNVNNKNTVKQCHKSYY